MSPDESLSPMLPKKKQFSFGKFLLLFLKFLVYIFAFIGFFFITIFLILIFQKSLPVFISQGNFHKKIFLNPRYFGDYISSSPSFFKKELKEELQNHCKEDKFYFFKNKNFLNLSLNSQEQENFCCLFVELDADFYLQNKKAVLEKIKNISRWYEGYLFFVLRGKIIAGEDIAPLLQVPQDFFQNLSGNILFSKLVFNNHEKNKNSHEKKDQNFLYALALRSNDSKELFFMNYNMMIKKP